MTKITRRAGAAVAAILLLTAGVGTASAASRASRGPRDVYVIGNFEDAGESVRAQPNYADGAQLAVDDLNRRGFHVTWERIADSGTSAIAAQDAFLASAAKQPDGIIGLSSSTNFVLVGPKIARTDVPFFALSSTAEGVRTGPSGGENIFMVRPLKEQTYAAIARYVCTTLRGTAKLKDVKVAVNVQDSDFGRRVLDVVNREVAKSDRCDVVNTTTSAFNATDQSAQVQAVKDSGANVIVSANFPGPTGELVMQARQAGLTQPIVGGEYLDAAVDAGGITGLDGLYVTDDCVPELEKDSKAKRFVKAYTAAFGYPPNSASAEVYDAVHILADAVKAVGHDAAALTRELATTRYDGVCDYANDTNNVLARSVTVYRYRSATDRTKVLVRRYPLRAATSAELASPTTTVPPTTAGS